ncbi:hypothetical protein [Devosia sp.]|uniref:hypothetical protein n=1 Tax=Devosia sp. TaxID=1871048 RepID=UPI003A95A220
MTELDRALADIVEIRARLAQDQTFLGLGPAALAATGLLALGVALTQTLAGPAALDTWPYFAAWIGLAVVAAGLLGAEMARRGRAQHGRMADQMILAAMFNFVPAAVAGTALFAVFLRAAPELVWLLPGLWLVLVSLGVFAAARSLPRGMAIAGGWYLLSGIAVLLISAETRTLSPWSMGLPFGLGQLGVAALVHRAAGAQNAR